MWARASVPVFSSSAHLADRRSHIKRNCKCSLPHVPLCVRAGGFAYDPSTLEIPFWAKCGCSVWPWPIHAAATAGNHRTVGAEAPTAVGTPVHLLRAVCLSRLPTFVWARPGCQTSVISGICCANSFKKKGGGWWLFISVKCEIILLRWNSQQYLECELTWMLNCKSVFSQSEVIAGFRDYTKRQNFIVVDVLCHRYCSKNKCQNSHLKLLR